MPFYVADCDSGGLLVSGTIVQLNPGPSLVRYPDKFNNVTRTSRDGTAIVQAANKDSRPRQWVWTRYTSNIINYDALYNTLLNYHHKNRQTASPPEAPWVFVKEDSSGQLTYRQWTGTTWVESATWVKALVTQVTQNVSEQADHTRWEETVFEWIIEDNIWNLF